ncbi:DMT family transporter [Mycobacterium sp. pUA109]|uniref:DMT family transporter n=1 Tax=Mycobacterium sp. pUA109 TaxID=3238982 RepID=UPI00351B6B13
MAKADMAVLLALAAALACAIGNVIRQRSAQEITDNPVGHLALFRMSVRDRRWQLGAAAAVANYALQAAALSLGSVLLVTGLQVAALLFALPIYARQSGQPVTRWQWRWAALLAGALAVVVTVGDPTAGLNRAPAETWIVVGAVGGPVVALCLLGARIWSGRPVAAVLLAAVAGASMALFAVLVKGVIEVIGHGVGAVLGAPEVYGCILAALAGMMLQQSAFRAGSLTASMPTMIVAKPVVGSVLGITVLGETLRIDGPQDFALVAAVLLVIVATAALARGEAATMTVHPRGGEATGEPAAVVNR